MVNLKRKIFGLVLVLLLAVAGIFGFLISVYREKPAFWAKNQRLSQAFGAPVYDLEIIFLGETNDLQEKGGLLILPARVKIGTGTCQVKLLVGGEVDRQPVNFLVNIDKGRRAAYVKSRERLMDILNTRPLSGSGIAATILMGSPEIERKFTDMKLREGYISFAAQHSKRLGLIEKITSSTSGRFPEAATCLFLKSSVLPIVSLRIPE